MDLEIEKIEIERNVDKLATTIDHTLEGPEKEGLNRFSNDRELLWTMSYIQKLSDYRDATSTETSETQTTVKDPVTIEMERNLQDVFDRINSNLDSITSEDILTIQLGQLDDPGNPLFVFRGEPQ